MSIYDGKVDFMSYEIAWHQVLMEAKMKMVGYKVMYLSSPNEQSSLFEIK